MKERESEEGWAEINKERDMEREKMDGVWNMGE